MRFAWLGLLLSACISSPNTQPLQSNQDVDHDGVADVIDKCAYDPGPDTNSGCPVTAPPPVAANPPPPVAVPPAGTLPPPAGAIPPPTTTAPPPPVAAPPPVAPATPGQPPGGYSSPPSDRDGDGVPDLEDRCPDAVGKTGNGCPR